jgi:hypothetical protein
MPIGAVVSMLYATSNFHANWLAISRSDNNISLLKPAKTDIFFKNIFKLGNGRMSVGLQFHL